MSIGARLKKWRGVKNLGQKEASALCGIPFRTFQNYELDHSPPGAESMKCFIRAGINANWLLSGEGNMLLNSGKDAAEPTSEYRVAIEYQPMPYYDPAIGQDNLDEHPEEPTLPRIAFGKDWLSQRGLQPGKCALIKARGDSMEPTIHDGDLLLVDTRIDSVLDDAIYVIQAEGHAVVKRIQKALDGSVIVINDNPRYEKQVIAPEQTGALTITGRVKWYGHEL